MSPLASGILPSFAIGHFRIASPRLQPATRHGKEKPRDLYGALQALVNRLVRNWAAYNVCLHRPFHAGALWYSLRAIPRQDWSFSSSIGSRQGQDTFEPNLKEPSSSRSAFWSVYFLWPISRSLMFFTFKTRSSMIRPLSPALNRQPSTELFHLQL